MLDAGNTGRARSLEHWIRDLQREYRGRILAVDEEVVIRWASLGAERTLPVLDGLIAATALEHGLTVATRNERDYADTGVAVFNPFAD